MSEKKKFGWKKLMLLALTALGIAVVLKNRKPTDVETAPEPVEN